MVKKLEPEVQQTLEAMQADVQAFLQDPPVSNSTYVTRDMVFDADSGDAVFREMTEPTGLGADVLYREVVQRRPRFGLAEGLVAKWFNAKAFDAVLTIQLWEDIGPAHPYYGRDFEAVVGAMAFADAAVRIPSHTEQGGHLIHNYQFTNGYPPTLEVTSYPGMRTLLNIQVAELEPQVDAYLHDPLSFQAKSTEVASATSALPTIQEIATLVTTEACSPRDAIINHYLGLPAVELISPYRDITEEQPLTTLAKTREAQERISAYFYSLQTK